MIQTKLCLFGGAFDPPHPGHIKLVDSVVERVKPDKTIIIPTGNAPHKTTQTDFETRFKLAQAAFPSYEVSDIENTADVSYTVNTLEKLHTLYPNSDFHLIVGEDALQSLDSWKEPERIKQLCTIEMGKRDLFSSTHIREKISSKRYSHSMNVAIACGQLAKHYGLSAEMSQKAYIAGILHDIMKECPNDKAKLMVRTSGLFPDYVEMYEPKLWHAIAGAKYVRDDMGITDPDIIDAIRFHTASCAGLSIISKIVRVADWISAERDYDGVDELRELAFSNLDFAVFSTIKASIKKTMKKGGKIPAYTISGYNYYLEESK